MSTAQRPTHQAPRPTPPKKKQPAPALKAAAQGGKRSVRAIEFPTEDPNTCALPEVYYHGASGSKDYLFRPSAEQEWFVRLNLDSLKRQLKGLGYCTIPPAPGALSELEVILNRVQIERSVAYAGPLAGHRVGLYQFGKEQVLVTNPPTIIEPAAGDWTILRTFLENLLGEPQVIHFYGWIKVAFESLRGDSGNHRPGQALFLAGPARCGKSLLQKLISVVLGGAERTANPYDYMSGKTNFNADLFCAEHLVIDDHPALKSSRERQFFTDNLKEIANPQPKRCHGKGVNALMLQPFWRLSISMNDSDENLAGFLQLTEGSADKLMLFKASFADMPMETFSNEQRAAFWAKLVEELPHMLHDLLAWDIPEEIRSPRFGILHYHNEEILANIMREQPEERLLEIIDAVLFSEPGSEGTPWEGKAVVLENLLRDMGYRDEIRQLLFFRNACGIYLSRLEDRVPDRVQKHRIKGNNNWRIFPPKQDGERSGK